MSGFEKIADGSLELMGLKKPDPALRGESKSALPSEMPLTFYTGSNLNADPKGRPIALVLKLYKLRDEAAFRTAPYAVLSDPTRDKEALGGSLIESREFVLLPEQKLNLRERLPEGTSSLGVVALFRSPAEERWRVSLPVEANAQGVSLGVHACALTVSQGVVSGMSNNEAASLSGVICR